jgi:cytochrome c553
MKEESPKLQSMLSIFLAVITTIVVVFLAQLVLDMKSELGEIKTTLATLRTESATKIGVEPFRALEASCTNCHSERRFVGIHGSSSELKQMINKMEALPDAHISAQDRDKIHASLQLLQCVRCHDDQALKKLATLKRERQREIINKMAEKPGSEIPPEAAEEIMRAYQNIQGF